jgi:hypothetical protein
MAFVRVPTVGVGAGVPVAGADPPDDGGVVDGRGFVGDEVSGEGVPVLKLGGIVGVGLISNGPGEMEA